MADTTRSSTVLPGHRIGEHGLPVDNEKRLIRFHRGMGHGLCECGALSPAALPSNRQRQKWHREHKDVIRAQAPQTTAPEPKHSHTEVRGHGLQHEGRPVDAELRRVSGKTGHGLCACGALSPELPSTSRRQEWHRGHKDEIRQELRNA